LLLRRCPGRRVRRSGTSVTFGKGLTAAAPTSALAGLIVSDIEAAHARGRELDNAKAIQRDDAAFVDAAPLTNTPKAATARPVTSTVVRRREV
jgi:hypothetical protein